MDLYEIWTLYLYCYFKLDAKIIALETKCNIVFKFEYYTLNTIWGIWGVIELWATDRSINTYCRDSMISSTLLSPRNWREKIISRGFLVKRGFPVWRSKNEKFLEKSCSFNMTASPIPHHVIAEWWVIITLSAWDFTPYVLVPIFF